ncbi:Agglutinin biogenesis protein MshP [Rubrivivax sp. A210]|uniref:agglutinin biogenesis protein MshP n=1 Tax=Rubrivivax sp. A210 TaxID=2772301 RepID=UPI001918BB5D|nr:agglutinin biogenesis protein MshP [Rubrivivax sp. A210]CAD5370281.1 Agglutinin biogenesis protein MshP [Rubrivivax sp. A210]
MSTTCLDRRHPGPPRVAAARGFTLISALFLVVVLAALGAALASISLRQHLGSAAEIETARALQAARAGLEWAAFQVLRNPAPPAAAPACFAATSFALAAFPGFTITVSCTRTPASGTVSDGATALVFFQLAANACNAPSGGACPSTAAEPGLNYVERQLGWTVMR